MGKSMPEPQFHHCELDLAAYSIKVVNAPAFDNIDYSIILRLLNLWKDSSHQTETVTINIQLSNERTCYLQTQDIKTALSFPQADDWRRFQDSFFPQLIDLFMARVLLPVEAGDVLWIEPSSSNQVWVLSLRQQTANRWQGQLVERDRLKKIDTSYCFMGQPAAQRKDVGKLFEQFHAWLAGDASPTHDQPCLRRRQLTIKVNPNEVWFLRFPLSVFCQLQYDGFADYESVEWIVTSKGFVQDCHERAQLRQELAHLPTLLDRSVIVINTYSEDEKASAYYRMGTELIIEILSSLQEIQFDDGKASLRWYLNPSAEVLERLLLDAQTAFFFADFEASKGHWESGDGPACSWQDSSSFQSLQTEAPNRYRDFLLEEGRYNLSHIRLMRVYHCNSIFDPYGGEPANRDYIVRSLLDAGAQRVEGGMTEETYFDYLCSLIYLFCRAEHMRFALACKCLERAMDFHSLMARVNEFLIACHRDPIPQ